MKYFGEWRPVASDFGSKAPSTPAIRQSIDVTESFWKSTYLRRVMGERKSHAKCRVMSDLHDALSRHTRSASPARQVASLSLPRCLSHSPKRIPSP